MFLFCEKDKVEYLICLPLLMLVAPFQYLDIPANALLSPCYVARALPKYCRTRVDPPNMHYFWRSDIHPSTFLKSPSNIDVCFITSHILYPQDIVMPCSEILSIKQDMDMGFITNRQYQKLGKCQGKKFYELSACGINFTVLCIYIWVYIVLNCVTKYT